MWIIIYHRPVGVTPRHVYYFLLDFDPHSNNISKQGSLKAKGRRDWILAMVITCECIKES